MSYAALGVFIPFHLTAGAAGECVGDVADDKNSACCPMDTWTAATYGAVVGDLSLRHWQEARIHALMAPLTAPSPPDATGIDKIAYDMMLPLPAPSLVQRIQRAYTNFKLLFPAGRWIPDPRPANTPMAQEYAACGPFPRWMFKEEPWKVDRIMALADVLGTPVPASLTRDLLNPLLTVVQGTPPAWITKLLAWLPKTTAVLSTVVAPTVARVAASSAVPLQIAKNYFKNVGGTLAPGSWMQQFMDVFAPSVMGMVMATAPLLAKMVQLAPIKPKISPAMMAQKIAFAPAPVTPKAAEEPALPRPEEPSGMATWLLVGGVVALAAGGYYLYTKKKKKPATTS